MSEAPLPAAPVPPRRLPLRKKLLFAVVMTAGFFGLLEGGLWLAGVEDETAATDPYVGFSTRFPLYEPELGHPDGPWLSTAENKLKLFNPQRFKKQKPDNTFRVFALGGSTTYGRPYDFRTSFPAWLEKLLTLADDSRDWEVINAGGISYASYRVSLVLEEVLRYDPDLIVIYTGQNEFLERRTYSQLLALPEGVRNTGAGLSQFRTSRLMRRLILSPSAPAAEEKDELPGEVEAILDRTVGPEIYHRDDEFRDQVVNHFEHALHAMVDQAEAAGVPVILVVPASNWKDCSPYKSEFSAGVTPDQQLELVNALIAASQALGKEDYAAARKSTDQVLALDDRYAESYFLHGQALYGLQEWEAAAEAFQRALVEDVCPLRAIPPIQDAVRRLRHTRNVPVIDFAEYIHGQAAHGIPGDREFLDHVHPTVEYHFELGVMLLEQMERQGLVAPGESWTAEQRQRLLAEGLKKIDRAFQGLSLKNLAKEQSWAGKDEEADQLALRAAEILTDDDEALTMAGNACCRLANWREAADYYEKALELNNNNSAAMHGLGLVFFVTEHYEAAEATFRDVVHLRPQHDLAWFNLGRTLLATKRPDEAVAAFQMSLEHEPENADAWVFLGRAYRQTQQPAEAIPRYELALNLRPDDIAILLELAEALREAGQTEDALDRVRQVLALQPDEATALQYQREWSPPESNCRQE